MKTLKWLSILSLMLFASFPLHAEKFAVKTNFLGWVTTSLNVGAEMAVGSRSTVQIFGLLNPWDFGNKHVKIWSVEPEYRYWLCQPFNGHFFGIHALGGEYNIKNVDLPFGILPKTIRNRHYEGWYAGAGVTYGYQWMLSRQWNLEASAGVGYACSPYKLYGRCARVLEKKTKHYFGPTKVAVSLMYVF